MVEVERGPAHDWFARKILDALLVVQQHRVEAQKLQLELYVAAKGLAPWDLQWAGPTY